LLPSLQLQPFAPAAPCGHSLLLLPTPAAAICNYRHLQRLPFAATGFCGRCHSQRLLSLTTFAMCSRWHLQLLFAIAGIPTGCCS
jgi:hypothetical protein